MPDYKTPGVYINETPSPNPTIEQVNTSIPVFIGYTEKAQKTEAADLLHQAKKVSTYGEYEHFYGMAQSETGINVKMRPLVNGIEVSNKFFKPNYLMAYAVNAFFANGGKACYIVSVGDYSSNGLIDREAMKTGLETSAKIDEVSLIVFPDGTNMTASSDYYDLIQLALAQCKKLQDRFTICDVYMHGDSNIDDVDFFRNTLNASIDELKYGAAYYPYLEMNLNVVYDDKAVRLNNGESMRTLESLQFVHARRFQKIKLAIGQVPLVLPPSATIAGVYARVDAQRGVWKAPANVNIDFAKKPVLMISNEQQAKLTVDSSGKSINAIRRFQGRGSAVVWGARTLAGNDNEWRYVPVRRFFNMVDESVKNGTAQFVFEPNDANTWVKIKSMVDNFLTTLWRGGALAGAKTEEAFFVKIGLNETMTQVDVLEGIMRLEIGMAVVRPAEFIILKIDYKMTEA